jgi:hypothetical protein
MGGMDSVASQTPSQEIPSNKVLQIRNLPGEDAAAKVVSYHRKFLYQCRVWNTICASPRPNRIIAHHYSIKHQCFSLSAFDDKKHNPVPPRLDRFEKFSSWGSIPKINTHTGLKTLTQALPRQISCASSRGLG